MRRGSTDEPLFLGGNEIRAGKQTTVCQLVTGGINGNNRTGLDCSNWGGVYLLRGWFNYGMECGEFPLDNLVYHWNVLPFTYQEGNNHAAR